MLRYPARLVPTETGAVKAMFPDVPEAVAQGKDENEALALAPGALEEALCARMKKEGKIPPPSDVCGAPMVTTEMFVIQECSSDWETPISGGRY